MVNLLHGIINVGLIVCFFCILLSAQKIDRKIPISFLSYEDPSIVVLFASFYLLSLNQCIWFRGGGPGLYLYKICQPMWNKPIATRFMAHYSMCIFCLCEVAYDVCYQSSVGN